MPEIDGKFEQLAEKVDMAGGAVPINWGELRDYVYAWRLGPTTVAEIRTKLKGLGLKVPIAGCAPEQHMWTVVYRPDTPLGSWLEKALVGPPESASPANLVGLVLLGAAVTKEQELRSLRETIDRLNARVKDQDEKILALRAIIDRIKIAVADI
ncbi:MULTISPECIES: hypothetical protein [Nocardia]|uniref:Uncharacterized protein n=1 Tax=Nocardia nova TaxID=37330 RepID=A0A2T2YVA8_9NOCA|nr:MULTISPECIES: hypothetical protein [Nocardia]PSR59455.1 hypothetical protein C8259_26715 [Nocardia nova]